MNTHGSTLLICAVTLVSAASRHAAAIELSAAEVETFNQAQRAQQAGQHNQVITLLEPVRQKYPREADLPRLLAHSYFELGRYDEAREAAVQAVALGRLSTDMLVRLTQIDRQRGDDLATLNSVRLLTITDAGNAVWRILYGDLLFAADHFGQARAVFARLVESDPSRADLWSRLGNAQMRLDLIDDATVSFQTAWELGERNESVARLLAGLQQRRGDAEATITWIERALAVQASPAPAMRLRHARLLFHAGEIDRARVIARQLSESSERETRAEASRLLGEIALRNDDIDAAVSHWRAAHEGGLGSDDLTQSLARLYFNQGNYGETARLLIIHTANMPDDNEAALLLARCALLSGDMDKARGHIQTYLEHFGMNDDIGELIRELAVKIGHTRRHTVE